MAKGEPASEPPEGKQLREPRMWPGYERPILLPVSGFRDQRMRITYLPWSDVILGAVGWEVLPDGHFANVLVYITPSAEPGGLEIRCHITQDDPDPENDPIIGTFTIPEEMLRSPLD